MVERGNLQLEKLFRDHDRNQSGGLDFQDFIGLNEFVGVSITKKDLVRVFKIIDKDASGFINMFEVKEITKLTWKEEPIQNEKDQWLNEDEDLQGEALLVKEQVKEIYEEIKNEIESKNSSLEQVIYTDLKINSMQLVTIKGIQQIMDKLGVIVSSTQANRIVMDLRKANNGRFENTYKDFIDNMYRRRVNVGFLEKGFIDPLLASCASGLVKIKEQYNLTNDTLYSMIVGSHDVQVKCRKDDFVTCVQGMDLKLTLEDINGFFNFCDEKGLNKITRIQFVNSLNFLMTKIGGQSHLESQMTKGALTVKKGQTNTQHVLNVVKIVCDGIQKRKLSIRQLSLAMDVNATGFVSRAEFVSCCQQVSDMVTLEQIRILMDYLDDKKTGKVSIIEFLRVCTDTLNSQIGGGVFAFMQVQPVIQSITNVLSVDCDRFFDEVADANQKFLEKERQTKRNIRAQNPTQIAGMAKASDEPTAVEADHSQCEMMGLSKTIFFQYLSNYGVTLKEQDKALISTVFGKHDHDCNKLDY